MKLLLLALTIILLNVPLNAQFTGYGNDQRTQGSIKLDPIDPVQPMKTDMSYDCMIVMEIL